MKKINKKDIIFPILLVLSFVIFYLFITYPNHYFGSTLDWESQHSVIPDYFRTLFYRTHDLFPDFALNLGSGQNIYNFSYYGLLSPIILISYFLPKVSMINYVIYSTITCVVLSSILFYFWFRKNSNTPLVSFLSSFTFLFATCLTFHAHRHIMFINYIPFLILGLYGVDKKLTQNKGWLLSLSIFLMIMTSYYYSVSGIICLVIYGIYKYISLNEKITLKKFLKDGFIFLIPFFIAILSSTIIILPTFYVILSGRGETFITITLKDLLIPSLNTDYILYDSYGIGLTSIIFYAITNLFLRKKENTFLGIVLSLMIIFPIFNYILNATMYIDAKALIPMLPLMTIAINLFINDLMNQKINLKQFILPLIIITIFVVLKDFQVGIILSDLILLTIFLILYNKFKKQFILIIPLLLIPFTTSLVRSKADVLVDKETKNEELSNLSDAILSITEEDKNLYRISNNLSSQKESNNIFGNINYYLTSLYSSTYNLSYNNFYYDTINNPVQNRNRVITATSNNIMSLIFFNQKYLLTDKKEIKGYDLYKELNNIKIYKSNLTLPFAYVSSNLISEEDFDNLSYPYTAEALLNNVVVNSSSNNDFISNIKPMTIIDENFDFQDLEIVKENNYYLINNDKSKTITYNLGEDYKDKIIFIRFNLLESQTCSKGDTIISINDINNKLTCKEWKYHNQNYQFDYVISDKDLEKLNITFSKGEFKLADIEMYYLDYSHLENINQKVQEFIPDFEKTKGDYIIGSIDVNKEGYFVTSIPYSQGFKVKVDNETVESEIVNKSFLGFKIDKGKHEVVIEFQAPFKNISVILSTIGILGFISMTIFEKKKK